MLFGHILTFLHFLGHSRLSGPLQAVRHEISRPQTFANSFLTTFWENSRIFREGQWGSFSKYRGFKVGGRWGYFGPSRAKNQIKAMVQHSAEIKFLYVRWCNKYRYCLFSYCIVIRIIKRYPFLIACLLHTLQVYFL